MFLTKFANLHFIHFAIFMQKLILKLQKWWKREFVRKRIILGITNYKWRIIESEVAMDYNEQKLQKQ